MPQKIQEKSWDLQDFQKKHLKLLAFEEFQNCNHTLHFYYFSADICSNLDLKTGQCTQINFEFFEPIMSFWPSPSFNVSIQPQTQNSTCLIPYEGQFFIE